MVVLSFDIDIHVLYALELIVVSIFIVFTFYNRQETFNKIMRLIMVSILFIINVILLPMEIQLEKSYGLTIFLIIIWFINALLITYDLGKDNWILQLKRKWFLFPIQFYCMGFLFCLKCNTIYILLHLLKLIKHTCINTFTK